MGLGVLEDKHLEHVRRPFEHNSNAIIDYPQVPGTALLSDKIDAESHHRHGNLDTSMLRHAKGRDSDIVLVPQPSRSPNDPLNWPLWKKDLMLFIICIDTAVVGAWVRIHC